LDGSVGAGRSRVGEVEDLRWRGKEDEDHHSRNLRRKIEVGRIRLRDWPRSGRRDVRRNVSGERDSEVLPATPFLAVIGGVSNQFGLQGVITVSWGPSLSSFIPIILNNGL
jgi:hypothetical protein